MSNADKLPHFSDAMKEYVEEAFSFEKSPSEVSVLFWLIFPSFGENFSDKVVLKRRVFRRICRIREESREKISELKTGSEREISEWKVRSSALYRLSLLIDLFNKTPHILSGEKQDKCNSANIMKIVDQMRIEMDRIDGFSGESLSLSAVPSTLPALIASHKIFGGSDADPGKEDAEESSDPPGE